MFCTGAGEDDFQNFDLEKLLQHQGGKGLVFMDEYAGSATTGLSSASGTGSSAAAAAAGVGGSGTAGVTSSSSTTKTTTKHQSLSTSTSKFSSNKKSTNG